MTDQPNQERVDSQKELAVRRQKLADLKAAGQDPFRITR